MGVHVALIRKHSCVLAVQIYRGYKSRQRQYSARVISSLYRGHKGRLQAHRLRIRLSAILRIQSLYRGHLGKEYVKKLHESASLIQGMVREHFARTQIPGSAQAFRDYDQSHIAALLRIQAAAQGFLTRKRITRIKSRMQSADGVTEAKVALQLLLRDVVKSLDELNKGSDFCFRFVCC